MRIDFVRKEDLSVLHSIPDSLIQKVDIDASKLVADDFFLREPAKLQLALVTDAWLLERWETDIWNLKNTIYLKHPVQVWLKNEITGQEELYLTGLLSVTDSSFDPFSHIMNVVVYDYSAVLADLDVTVRFYYPHDDTGTVFSHFIINYKLPGEKENEVPEDNPEDTNPYDDPAWYPYQHTITTTDRQVSTCLIAISQIISEAVTPNLQLTFHHDYQVETPGVIQVNNSIVSFGEADSFYRLFVLGLVNTAWQSLRQLTGVSYYAFFANYGILPAAQRWQIWTEFSILPPEDVDCYFVMRSGYQWQTGATRDMAYNHGAFSYGEYSPENAIFSKEWYRIFGVKAGRVTYDSQDRYRFRQQEGLGEFVGTFLLDTAYLYAIDENTFYRGSANDLYHVPETFQNAVMDYFYSMTYYLYYTGPMESESHLGNRIFRMKGKPGEEPQNQYLENSISDWLKILFFVADLSAYADEFGVIRYVSRGPVDSEATLPLASMTEFKQKLLIYQPWDQTKLKEIIDDPAEIVYLVDYYGGARAVTHQLELGYTIRGLNEYPQLRQYFDLPAQIWGVAALSQAGRYMIVEISRKTKYELVLRAIRVGE